MSDDQLSPEDFAEAAASAITEAMGKPETMAATLAEAGLFSVMTPEDAGGLGLSRAFAVPVLREAGKAGLRFPVAEQMLLATAFAGTPEGEALLSGAKTGTLAWSGDLESGAAGHAGYINAADLVLVASASGAVLLRCDALQITEDGSIDPEAPQGYFAPVESAVVARLTSAAFAQLQADAEVLYAALAVGCAEGALARAAAHVSTRVQFGRSLSAKQAVRHHMARMKLSTELAAAQLARALQPDEFGAPRVTGSALTLALSSGSFVVEKAIQLHGGMGFTWELPLHYPLRELRRLRSALRPETRQAARGRAFIDAL